MKRKTCIICKRKRYSKFMTCAFKSAYCCTENCIHHNDISNAKKIIHLIDTMEILDIKYIYNR